MQISISFLPLAFTFALWLRLVISNSKFKWLCNPLSTEWPSLEYSDSKFLSIQLTAILSLDFSLQKICRSKVSVMSSSGKCTCHWKFHFPYILLQQEEDLRSLTFVNKESGYIIMLPCSKSKSDQKFTRSIAHADAFVATQAYIHFRP